MRLFSEIIFSSKGPLQFFDVLQQWMLKNPRRANLTQLLDFSRTVKNTWHFEGLLLFLSLRYGADLYRSRLVSCIAYNTLHNSNLQRTRWLKVDYGGCAESFHFEIHLFIHSCVFVAIHGTVSRIFALWAAELFWMRELGYRFPHNMRDNVNWLVIKTSSCKLPGWRKSWKIKFLWYCWLSVVPTKFMQPA